jgi:hypothetical protein
MRQPNAYVDRIFEGGCKMPPVACDANSVELMCTAMNRLIVACKYDMIAHSALAATIRDPFLREQLVEQARLRGSFVRDLGAAIRSLGGALDQTPGMGLFLEAVREKLLGKTTASAYAVCVRVTAMTEGAYSAALLLQMPNDARRRIKRHLAEIRANRMRLELRTALS